LNAPHEPRARPEASERQSTTYLTFGGTPMGMAAAGVISTPGTTPGMELLVEVEVVSAQWRKSHALG